MSELTDEQILAVFRTAANPDKNVALEFGRALIAAHEAQRQAEPMFAGLIAKHPGLAEELATRYPPAEVFAIVVDRVSDEGLSLAIHDGVNYTFSDGDCFERDGDTLGGYTAEFLTHYQLERRLSAATPAQAAPAGPVNSDQTAL